MHAQPSARPAVDQGATAATGNHLLDAALTYAGRGWAVIPLHSPAGGACSCRNPSCTSPGKHPRTPHGLKDASTSPEQIRSWWRVWPDANVGVVTGVLSGIVVLDIDGAAGDQGIESEGWNRPTPTALTGRGRHLFFGHPMGGPVKNSTALRIGVDVRGDGGYVVAPPSRHASGRTYAWDDENHLGADLSLAPLPTPLLEELRSDSRARGPLIADVVLEGERNNRLTKHVGALFARGWTDDEVLHDALQTNADQFLPPLPESEVHRIVESIASREQHRSEQGAGRRELRIAQWPSPLAPAAFLGLPGEFVRTVLPHTEADPAALLVQFLVAFGIVIGRGPHFCVEGDQHGLNLFSLILGNTSKGRKGSSWGQVRRVFALAVPDWTKANVKSGLTSGEGVIYHVRDESRREKLVKQPSGRIVPEEVVEDTGVRDKRILVIESEFVSALRVMRRESNILSSVIRQAWDSGDLRTLAKNSPLTATGAHLGIVGHITAAELRRQLDQTEIANGFLNRFLLVCATRSQLLPEGGALDPSDVTRLATELETAIAIATKVGELKRDEKATLLWRAVYPELSSGQPGLVGAATSRSEAQVVRLACLFALSEGSHVVAERHLQAGLAVWKYCEESAGFVFGGTVGDPIADELLVALKRNGDGLTRTEIRGLFSNHRQGDVDRALQMLAESGQAKRARDPPKGGRPAVRWMATEATEVEPEVDVQSLRSPFAAIETGDAWEEPNGD